ncbi:RDD family protein [Apibacter muscae]|uniref:RDD family protein n=1 Tax=Apibacter muscae TaxID=2509004 RepID=A0A563DHZ8_9FLAO|nr:RDD family protein [Apibacter muscae]TWP24833.1 RDD family protein [Apibacter muscae]TWP29888.1 RDD family protein [Apibacter muscae]TWP31036.1 RDD family protein [Apibacter muscae]
MKNQQIVANHLAPRTLRFLSYAIDIIVFYILIFSTGILSPILNARGWIYLLGSNPLIDRLFAMVLFVIYFFLLESLLKGKTIGKLITGTRVVTEEGEKPSIITSLKRNLIRIVPFDTLSFFGEIGWHDRWSKTRVVKAKNFDREFYDQTSIDDLGK